MDPKHTAPTVEIDWTKPLTAEERRLVRLYALEMVEEDRKSHERALGIVLTDGFNDTEPE